MSEIPDIPIIRWEKTNETRVQGSPNDYQAAKDMWFSRLLDAFPPIYGISINTDEIISNDIFVVDIINEWTQQIRVVFAHPNHRGNDRSTRESKIWKTMIDSMTRYLCQVRRERMALQEVIQLPLIDENTYYTIIAVGRNVRFFALEADSYTLMDSSGTNGEMYDAFHGKDQIRGMFWELSRNNCGLWSA